MSEWQQVCAYKCIDKKKWILGQEKKMWVGGIVIMGVVTSTTPIFIVCSCLIERSNKLLFNCHINLVSMHLNCFTEHTLLMFLCDGHSGWEDHLMVVLIATKWLHFMDLHCLLSDTNDNEIKWIEGTVLWSLLSWAGLECLVNTYVAILGCISVFHLCRKKNTLTTEELWKH